MNFGDFHFLRPLWLLALAAVAIAWWFVRRRESKAIQMGGFVVPHLRDALTVNRSARIRVQPIDGIILALIATVVAAAGPTWSRQASPWFAETAPLVIAIEVSDSMRSNDLQPSRLERARFEILDLLDRRTGSRTAVIAYAGSAHVVMPLAADVSAIKPFLESLDPAIMPTPGADAHRALPLALELLGENPTSGTLLFVNDGFDSADVSAFAEFAQRTDVPALVTLVVGNDEGGVAFLPDGSPVQDETGARLDTSIDSALLRRIGREADMQIVRAVTGDGDLRRLMGAIESNLQQADDPDARWRDEGRLALWPAAILTLLWFRRGWTTRW
ncbi:MAG: Ca-activated chloride channel family protein [Hyphomicrobiaceae bacterium]|jgi:Ca-activated chloride channel family protein